MGYERLNIDPVYQGMAGDGNASDPSNLDQFPNGLPRNSPHLRSMSLGNPFVDVELGLVARMG